MHVLFNALNDDRLQLPFLGLDADEQVQLLHQVTNQSWGGGGGGGEVRDSGSKR